MICFSTLDRFRSRFSQKSPKSKCAEDDTIKLIETSKNKMLNIEKSFIRSVNTSPEKVIFVASNQQVTDLVGFCTDLRNFCIIGVDPT